jgi:phospholipid/cholesterol/gamma-HCH transport system permease protein
VASLTAFSVGLTLAMQAAAEMGKLGADAYVPDLVCVTLLRELGPMLVAVIVTGRSGSAVTAELGTMTVSEEIEALTAMAINPVRFLIVPRFIAMLVMLPVLTIFGHYIGNVGGWFICTTTLDMSTANYIVRALERATFQDLYVGMIKSFVFAWLIITIACHYGLSVRGGAEGVGLNTTRSVVVSPLGDVDRQRRTHRNLLLCLMNDTADPSRNRENEQPIIEVKDLVREFSGRAVLNGISLKVYKGRHAYHHGGQRMREKHPPAPYHGIPEADFRLD